MTGSSQRMVSRMVPRTSRKKGGDPVRVSVIIPTHDRAEWVGEAVESVLSQQGTSFEVIVVDDGSRDDTPVRLTSFGDAIRVLRQENRGVSAARNRGIREARGEFVALLDSDDLWKPGKLAVQVAFLDAHPDALVCQTGEIWVRNGVRVNPGRRHRKPSGMMFEASLELCLVSPSAVMMRRRLFDLVGMFDESLPACEDYDLWLRVARRHPIHLLEGDYVVKRGGHADQLSRLPGLDRYRVRSIAKILEEDERGGSPERRLSPEQRRAAIEFLQRKAAIYAAGARKHGRFAEATETESLAMRFEA